MILRANPFFEKGNAKFIEDVEYGGSTGLRRFVFEEEYVIIPTVAIENDQVTMLDLDKDANPENLDTLELPSTHNEEPYLIHEEEQQQPQLEVPLRRSTRERRTTIPDDYIVYL